MINVSIQLAWLRNSFSLIIRLLIAFILFSFLLVAFISVVLCRATPLSLSWSLILTGVFGMEFSLLSVIFDPLAPDVAGPKTPQLTDCYAIRDFFGRCSKWTMSMYLWHAVIINASLRIAGYVEDSDADTYLYYKSVWPLSLWSGSLFLFVLGLVYFVIVYLLFILWEKKGKGIGTFEWMLGLGARGIWSLFGNACCCCPRIAYNSD